MTWYFMPSFFPNPAEDIPFRMADYRLRVYRRWPEKKMIWLWEQPKELFLHSPGLLPFAVLSDTDNRSQVLNQCRDAKFRVSTW